MLNGRYQLTQRIAAGGMGEVWRGNDVMLKRDIGVKVILPALMSDRDFITRFRSEARMMAALRHPGIVQVYDYGENAEVDGRNLDFMVMEFIEGTPLAKRIQQAGRLSPADTMKIVDQVGDALHTAHQAGIVHRDVKPSNLLVRPNGSLVLVDFGVARETAVEGITGTNVVLGSAHYMAPEQAEGHKVTPLTDVYALGAVAYACLTGRPPYVGDNPLAVLAQLVHGKPPVLPPDVPAGVAAVVMRALDREPARRFPNAAALAAAARSAGEQPHANPTGGYGAPTRPMQSGGFPPHGPGGGTGTYRNPSGGFPGGPGPGTGAHPGQQGPGTGSYPGRPAPSGSFPSQGGPSGRFPSQHPGGPGPQNRPGGFAAGAASVGGPATGSYGSGSYGSGSYGGGGGGFQDPPSGSYSSGGYSSGSHSSGGTGAEPPRRNKGMIALVAVAVAAVAVGIGVMVNSFGDDPGDATNASDSGAEVTGGESRKPSPSPTKSPKPKKTTKAPEEEEPEEEETSEAPQTNDYDPVELCGGGYRIVETKDLAGAAGVVRGKVYLLRNDASVSCVVTMKEDNLDARTNASATLEVQGQAPQTDSGAAQFYIGPVSAESAGSCVRWGGSIGNQKFLSEFGNCA